MINASAGIKLCCQSAVKGPLMYNKASVEWTLWQSLQGQMRSTHVVLVLSPCMGQVGQWEVPSKVRVRSVVNYNSMLAATPLLCQPLRGHLNRLTLWLSHHGLTPKTSWPWTVQLADPGKSACWPGDYAQAVHNWQGHTPIPAWRSGPPSSPCIAGRFWFRINISPPQ